jgi:23S rRNA (pseudouridine1915-N3)-methyltransferase
MIIYCKVVRLKCCGVLQSRFCTIITLQLYNISTTLQHSFMKITFLTVGKTEDTYLKEGIDKYVKRLKHYTKLVIIELDELKNTKALTSEQQKTKEAELILKKILPLDHVVLLDENGMNLSSRQFAGYLEKKALSSVPNIVFVVGGPYGFDRTVYERANDKLSLSAMTFSHQMIRLFFIEQLYRAFTIIKGEPYHHE